MSGKQTLNEIKNKINKILPYENFYSFKLFPNEKDKNEQEREELLRLIEDARNHGKWYIDNFNFD
jgi:hypothetical protein